jgi:pentatricopeptide repeat protein
LPSAARIRLRDRNRRRLVRLHYERPDAARFAAWFYPTRILLMAGYGIRGELDRARAVWRGMVET